MQSDKILIEAIETAKAVRKQLTKAHDLANMAVINLSLSDQTEPIKELRLKYAVKHFYEALGQINSAISQISTAAGQTQQRQPRPAKQDQEAQEKPIIKRSF